MSHFTVLVIGDDYEKQLAPYDEEIEVAPYRDYADEGTLKWYARLYREHHDGQDAPSDTELAKFLREQWEEDDLWADEKGVYRLSTYNPNSKCDWYQVGGRWAGFFKVKEGVWVGASQKGDSGLMGAQRGNDADVVHKGDVDVEAMRDDAGERAAAKYDVAASVLRSVPSPRPWSEIYKETKAAVDALPDDVPKETTTALWDKARNSYRNQPAVKAFDEVGRSEGSVLSYDDSPEDFDISREEFIQRARDRAIVPFAYVVNGEWFAPGRMGWFGSRTETDDDRLAFVKAFNEVFDALPDDTLLTLVDCHI